MFVRRRKDVTEVEFPKDLKKLGLFINERDEVRQIENPKERFEFKVFQSQRLNERRKEALVSCLREIILGRLRSLGMEQRRLTVGTHHASVQILTSSDLTTNASRCLLLFPNEAADLGTWSNRSIESENNISSGSMVNIVKWAQSEGFSVIIGNTGALIYDTDLGTTVTQYSWAARQKPWKMGGRIRNFDPSWNLVKGSEDPEAHVKMVFEQVVRRLVPKDTRLYVLADGVAAGAVIGYMDNHWNEWKDQMHTMVFGEPSYSSSAVETREFKAFLNKMARAYVIHEDPRGQQLVDYRFGCSTFSAQTLFHECIIPFTTDLITEYFTLARDDPEWCNPSIVIEVSPEASVHDALNEAKKGFGKTWGDGSTPGCGW